MRDSSLIAIVLLNYAVIFVSPIQAQDSLPISLSDILEQTRIELARYRLHVEQLEHASAPEGTEGAAQKRLQELRTQLVKLEEQIESNRVEVAAGFARVEALIAIRSAQWKDMPDYIRIEPHSPESIFISSPRAVNDDEQITPSSRPNMRDEVDGNNVAETTINAPGANASVFSEFSESHNALPSNGPLLIDDLYQRVLSRPGAVLRSSPGDNDGKLLPTFTVLYVFEERKHDGEIWLAVGTDQEAVEGWLRGGEAEEWRSMLVMQYAPKSLRRRVVFFRDPDQIKDIIEDFDSRARAVDIYRSIETNNYDPKMLVTIEPQRAVDSSERPYLMPVLDWQRAYFDSGTETTLLQLAGLNHKSKDGKESFDALSQNSAANDEAMREFTTGIAFVIDTTASMGPYIQSAQGFVRNIYARLADEDLQDRFRFALVGYRDNTAPDERIEYVTRIFQDLDQPSDPDSLFANIQRMKAGRVSTENWREDAFAGLEDAMEDLAWDQTNSRIVVLITDASAREVGDRLARDPALGVRTIASMANQGNFALFILHMQTEEAEQVARATENYDDHSRGERQYAALQETGNLTYARYFRVQGNTETAFDRSLTSVENDLFEALKQFASGSTISAVGPDTTKTTTSIVSDEVLLLADNPKGVVITKDNASLVSRAVVSELFRYQQEYLGTLEGTEAPAFYRAWAADRDLVDPRYPALDVAVFMTRAQLSDLADRLTEVINALNAKKTGMGDFFKSVRERSGRAVVDPKISDFLPSYLDDLPYASVFLNMNRATWDSLGSAQEDLLADVEAKIEGYRRISASQGGWLQVSGRSAQEQVYPLPLRELP